MPAGSFFDPFFFAILVFVAALTFADFLLGKKGRDKTKELVGDWCLFLEDATYAGLGAADAHKIHAHCGVHSACDSNPGLGFELVSRVIARLILRLLRPAYRSLMLKRPGPINASARAVTRYMPCISTALHIYLYAVPGLWFLVSLPRPVYWSPLLIGRQPVHAITDQNAMDR